MRRVIAAFIVLASAWVLMGQTYAPRSYVLKSEEGTYFAKTYQNATSSSSSAPDSSALGPFWATLASNGSQPRLFFVVDYGPLVTDEAVYCALREGANHTGNGMPWSHQFGDSTASVVDPSASHTSTGLIDSVAFEGDTLDVFVKIWVDDAPHDSLLTYVILHEQEDTTPPEFLDIPFPAYAYSGNGGQAVVYFTGGTYSEPCYKIVRWTYTSTYPSYGDETDPQWLYKTASVGSDSLTTTNTGAGAAFLLDRVYHSDQILITMQLVDLAGNMSDEVTLEDASINMPIGPTPTFAHDEAGLTMIQLGDGDIGGVGEGPLSATVAQWAEGEVAIVDMDNLLEHYRFATGNRHWWPAVRAYWQSNMGPVFGHMSESVWDNPDLPRAKRAYDKFSALYDSCLAVGTSADTNCISHTVSGNLAIPNMGNNNASRYRVNLANTLARNEYAQFIANEWNHGESRAMHTGPMFDVWDPVPGSMFWNGAASYFAADSLDGDLDGTAIGSDYTEQQNLRTARATFIAVLRARIAATNPDTVAAAFLVGANSVTAKNDLMMLSSLDMLQFEDFMCPAGCNTGYDGTPFQNALDASFERSVFADYDLLFENGDLPDSVGWSPTISSVKDAMRTAGGGPWIVLEGRCSCTGNDCTEEADPAILESYSLLWDNVYPEYLYYPDATTTWERRAYHPLRRGLSDLEGLGAATSAMTADSTGSLLIYGRSYENGTVAIQMLKTAAFDCATDAVNYQTIVDSVTQRESAGFDSDIDTTAPVLSDFQYAWHDTTSTILFGASYDTDETGGTLTKEFYWVSEGASYQSGGTAAVSQYDDAIFYIDTNDATSVLPDTIHVRGTATDATGNVSNVIHLAVYIERKPADDETAPVLTIEDFLVDALDPDGEIRCLATVTTDETATLGVTWKRFVGGTYADTLWSDGEVDTLVATIETDITPVDNDTFYLRAVGYDAAENYATAKWTTDVADFPDQPTSLVATGGDGEIALDWDDNAEGNISGYDVYRRNAAGSLALFDEDIATSNYTDSTVPNDSTYYYTVTAKDDLGFVSAQSAEDSDAAAAGGGDPYTWIFDQGSTMPYFATWGYSTSDTTGNTDHTTTIERAAVTWNNMATVTSDQGALWAFPSASDTTYGDSSNRLMLMLHFPDISAALSGATIDSARIFFRTSTAIDFSDASDFIDFIIPNNNVYDEWTDGTTAGDYDCSGNYADASTTTAWSETFSWSAASGLGWVTRFGWGGATYDTTADDGDDTCRLSTTGVQAWADGTHEPQIWISPTLTMGLRGLSVANLTARPSIVIWGTK